MELEPSRAAFEHLPEDALEKYAFGRLPAAELDSFEFHLLHCELCRGRLDTADDFVEAMRVLEQMSGLEHSPGLERTPGLEQKDGPLTRSNYAVESEARQAPIVVAPPSDRRGFWTRLLPSHAVLSPMGFTPAWGAALLVVLVTGIYALRMPPGRGYSDEVAVHEAQTVTLTTLRGGLGRASEGVAQAQAGRPLDLIINTAATAIALPEAGPYRLEVVDAAGNPRWTGAVSPSASGQITARMNKAISAGTFWVRLYAPGGKLLREFGLHVN